MPHSPTLRVPTGLLSGLEDMGRDVAPDEACGCLVGRAAADGAHVVEAAPRIRNLVRGPRFELDPVGLVTLERAARAAGRRILGTWHTHPHAPARLGAADRRGAVAGWSQLVLGVDAGGRSEARSWRGTRTGPVQECLEPDSS